MGKNIEIPHGIGAALEDYYLGCGVLPPMEVADFTSTNKQEPSTPLNPGQKVTLATKSAPTPQG